MLNWILQTKSGVDYYVLIAACLLHDVGRKEQFESTGINASCKLFYDDPLLIQTDSPIFGEG